MSTPDAQPLYHGTKADLKAGDLIGPGFASNYSKRRKAAYVYLTATLDAATWGAELASGGGRGRIYIEGFTSWSPPARSKTIPT
jgi:rifampin ADP-ribosylating transferase